MNEKLDDFAMEGKPEWFAQAIVEVMTTNGFTIEDVQKSMATLQKSVKDTMMKDTADIEHRSDKTSIVMKLGAFIKEGNPEMIASTLVERMTSAGCDIGDMQKRMADLQKSVSYAMFRDPDMHKRLKENENKSRNRESGYSH